ncbi:MAG: hypothetical protein QW505_02340 [Thermoplasmata archaeon]
MSSSPPHSAVNLVNPKGNQPYALGKEDIVRLSREARRKTRVTQVMGIVLLIVMLFIIWLVFFVLI